MLSLNVIISKYILTFIREPTNSTLPTNITDTLFTVRSIY